MEDTLDTYSISKKLIATNNLKPQEYSKLLESNAYEAFISLLNNHEISYNIGNYLFKAEQPLGEKAIRILYNHTIRTCLSFTPPNSDLSFRCFHSTIFPRAWK